MSLPILVAVAVGGLIGAPARYLADRALARWLASGLPWGTFAVNASGSLLLGLLTGLALRHLLGPLPQALLATGFCGSYTTFSTFSFETVRLLEEGRLVSAFANAAGSVAVGLAAAAAGLVIGLAS